MLNKLFRIFLLCLALNTSWALTQDPTMAEVYAAAQAGQLDKAQTMIQQVLISHPRSAKAHYVRAELFARGGNGRLAQDALQEAEHLAPGLPFASPEAVKALRAQIGQLASRAGPAPVTTPAVAANSSDSIFPSLPWLLLAGGAALLGFLFLRNRQTAAAPVPGTSAASGGPVLSGPQIFGHGAGMGYPAPAPAPAPDSGMGSRIMGGVATGLAVGAGVMAAEAIGRRLMDHDEPVTHAQGGAGIHAGSTPVPFDTNADMGGSNFGIADDSWGSDADTGSGADWDN